MTQIMTEPTLRDRRVALRISERELAEMASVSRTSVRKYERGETLRPAVKAAIERALDTAEVVESVMAPGLYYVPREGGPALHLTAETGAPTVAPIEASVLRGLLGYALNQYAA